MVVKYTVATPHLQNCAGKEVLIEFEHGELGGVEDLVAELSITLHAENFEVNITPY